MKFQSKHYFEIGLLPYILLAVIALTFGLTRLWDHRPNSIPETHFSHPFNWPDPPDPEKLAQFYKVPEPDTDRCERAVFGFTGDTVLALKGPTFDEVAEGLQKILYKNKAGTFKLIDLPVSEIKVLKPDSADTASR